MRYKEEMVQPKKEPQKEKTVVEKPQAGKYTSEQLSSTKQRPFLGGNSFGRS